MATYLSGVTDYVPKIQPFHPDLNFYNSVLSTKEAQYQEGYQKISSLYGTLLNSAMLREPDVAKRDKYFKDIHQEIQRLSGVDLSMPQNVSQARQIFQPLLDDKNIVSDIVLTKKWNAERSAAESLRNCVETDKTKCKGWWQPGMDNLNYWAEDYSKTTDEEALMYSKYDWSPRYVPYVDVSEKFRGLVKDLNLKVTTTSFTPDGRFIVEQTNGNSLTLPLTNLLTGTIGQDPTVNDMYRVLAENSRHQWINANAPQYNGDRAMAEDAYNVLVQQSFDSLKTEKKTIDKAKQAIDAKVNVVKQQIDQMPNGTSEDSPLVKTLNLLLDEQAIAESAASKANDALTTIERSGMFTQDRIAKRKELDYGVGYQLMQKSMFDLANSYAQGSSETKIKVNEYKLTAEKFANEVALAQLKNSLEGERDYLKHQYKLEEDLNKARLKGEALPSTIPNTYSPLSGETLLGGAGTPGEDVLGSQFTQQHKLASQRESYKTNAVKQFYSDLANAADSEMDPVKKQYAISQLHHIFGEEKGSDGSYSTRQLKNPDKYFNEVVAMTNDKVYNTTFPGVSAKVKQDIQNFDIENKAIMAYHKTTEKNIANLYSYLETKSGTIKNSSKDDILRMKAVIDEKTGNTRSPADIQKKLAASNITVSLEEAADIRLDYQEKFRKHYGSSYTMGDGKTPVVRPYDWHPGMPVNTGGVAAYPTKALVGTDFKTVNQATLDALTMYDWMQKNASSQNYTLYPGTAITSEMKGEGIKPEDGGAQYNMINYALNTLRKEFKPKSGKGALSEGMAVTLHPIAMNDKNMRGFTISIPESLFNKWEKEQGQKALDYKDFSSFTIVMPADKAPSEIFGRFDPKPIKAILRNGGTLSITDPNAGDIKLYGNNDGTVGISGYIKYIPPGGTQTVQEKVSPLGMNPFVDPDYLYNKLSEEIRVLGQKNLELIMSPYNPINVGKITSGEQAEQLIKAQQLVQGQ